MTAPSFSRQALSAGDALSAGNFSRYQDTLGPSLPEGHLDVKRYPDPMEDALSPAKLSDEVDDLVAAWHTERPDLDVTPLQVLSRVSRLARHLDLARRASFASRGLETWEFDVLSALRRAGTALPPTPRGPLPPGLLRQPRAGDLGVRRAVGPAAAGIALPADPRGAVAVDPGHLGHDDQPDRPAGRSRAGPGAAGPARPAGA